jgi:hypothetical protein
MRNTISLATTGVVFAAGLLALAGAASASELKAYAGQSIELKDVRGLVYFTPKGETFEVVTTLDTDGHAFRVISSLKDGQSTILSAPGALGEDAATVEIRREGDSLSVTDRTRQHRADATLPNAPRAD